MSAETSGYVWTSSPYEGATFTVHLALGDIANDAHDYEIWVLTKNLAAKARVSGGTARKAILRLVDDGFLEVVEDRSDRNQPSRYRFLMPTEGRATDATGRATDATPVAPQTRPVAPQTRHNKREPNDEKPNDGNPSRDLGALFEIEEPAPTKPDPLDGFDEFWSLYPRRVAKGAARKVWPKAVEAAGGSGPILDGARRYAAERKDQDPSYTKHPTTWLNQECWLDEPTRPAERPGPLRGVDQDRSGPEGRIEL